MALENALFLALAGVAAIAITEWLRHRSYVRHRQSGFVPGTQHIAMIGTFVAGALFLAAVVVGLTQIAPWYVIALAVVVIVVGVALGLPLFWLVMYLLTPLWKYQLCPKCQKRKLVMCWAVRSNPPSPVFYKCLACGSRYTRTRGEWLDASDPKYDAKYASPLLK
jgi:hypothetical protein